MSMKEKRLRIRYNETSNIPSRLVESLGKETAG
jgi:hypothetical protein